MNPNVKLSEKIAILATIDSINAGVGTTVSTYVSLTNFHQVAALLKTGVMGAAGTIDAKLVQATSAAGAGSKDITGKAITQIVKASGDSSQVLIEVHGSELDVNNAFAFVALSVTVGVAASQLDVTMIGSVPRFASASASNQAGVKQIV